MRHTVILRVVSHITLELIAPSDSEACQLAWDLIEEILVVQPNTHVLQSVLTITDTEIVDSHETE